MNSTATTAVPAQDARKQDARQVEPLGGTGWLLPLVLACHAPLLWEFFANLFRYRPHYEFAPFLVVAAALLMRQRWPDGPPVKTRVSRWLARLSLSLGFVILAAAIVFYSPWLAAIAAIWSLGGAILWTVGRDAIRQLFSAWLLLWLVIPPPFMLDARLIQNLQALTSRGASRLLDWFEVLHMRSGNVIRLPDQLLFVAEACSGVHSQLLLVAMAALVCAVRRRPVVHTVCLLLAATIWSVAVNIARVTIVVAASSQQIQLADGWQHEALGYALILVGLLLLLSTDRLLEGVLGPISERWLRKELKIAESRYGRTTPALKLGKLVIGGYNRWIAGVRSPSQPTRVESATPGKPAVKSRGALVISASFFVLLLGQGLLLLAIPASQEVQGEELYERITEDDLPAQIGELTRVRHESLRRESSSDEGEFSQTWEYRTDDLKVKLSMDFPFVGWHHLPHCYEAQGWEEIERRTLVTDLGHSTEVLFRKQQGNYAVLQFSLHTADGAAIEPPRTLATIGEKLAGNPVISMLRGKQVVPESQTTLQFQQLIEVPISPDERLLEQSRRLFAESQRVWRASRVFAGESSG